MDHHTHRHINSNNRKAQERGGIPPLGALWPITKGKEVTHDEQAEVDVIEDTIGNLNPADIETLILHRSRQNELQSPHFPASAHQISCSRDRKRLTKAT